MLKLKKLISLTAVCLVLASASSLAASAFSNPPANYPYTKEWTMPQSGNVFTKKGKRRNTLTAKGAF